jgi:TetR/AcrR family transcriptional regulator, transcriptional repressor for nem operon
MRRPGTSTGRTGGARTAGPAKTSKIDTNRYNLRGSAATARTARGDETRRQILAAAADLFHKQGVVATSPDQVIEASGTGKGQFYHYFKNKERLVHEVLQTYLEEIRQGGGPLNYDIRSWEHLEQWFLGQIALQKVFRMTRGCPFGTIGNEVTENDELIRQDLSLIFEVARGKIAAFFVREKASGRLDPQVREDEVADYSLAMIQGAMLLGKVKRSSQLAESVVREALAHLKRYAGTYTA